MSLLEAYVQALSRDLTVGGEERERILAELRQHLEEAKLEFIAAGHACVAGHQSVPMEFVRQARSGDRQAVPAEPAPTAPAT
jgi:hypothetical protein